MKNSRDAALARMGRESAEHIRSSTASIEDSTRHVLQSKAAIERSLDLLRDTRPCAVETSRLRRGPETNSVS